MYLGLGSVVAEVLVGAEVLKVPIASLALSSQFAPVVGDPQYLRALFGLSLEAVTEKLIKLVAKAGSHNRP